MKSAFPEFIRSIAKDGNSEKSFAIVCILLLATVMQTQVIDFDFQLFFTLPEGEQQMKSNFMLNTRVFT